MGDAMRRWKRRRLYDAENDKDDSKVENTTIVSVVIVNVAKNVTCDDFEKNASAL